MQKSRMFGGVLACALALSVLSVAGPAVAAETGGDQKFPAMQMIMDESGQPTTSTFTVDPGTYSVDGTETVLRAAATYTCSGKTDSPHYSKNGGSVIAKTRVNCSGPSGVIPIRVYSLLGKTSTNNISTLKIVAESNYVQNVTVNSPTPQTWYVPAQGSPTKIAAGAYFRGSHSGAGAPPLQAFNIGAAPSSFVYVPKP
ncbi:hypothetical protein [Frigoribacterium sp. CFBP 13707]|uniref:hypothetical protein n=1 Tax=Frigoribacterium sp. CFBP 13707 TaxID=2775313 RepID=UPI001781D347|nr:hypothetical protein [Frigoribacterium sp. CFBP 13707]MBD8729364.1 hypothetical protein [Frigoribacterium sp. CFBP 13707]